MKITEHIDNVNNWNEFCRNNTIWIAHPNSEQTRLQKKYFEAIDYFYGLEEKKYDDGNITLRDTDSGAMVEYSMQGEYENFRLVRSHDPRFTRHNDDGTTTVGNHTLIITLPTDEFNEIGRYGVFNDAMMMFGNKSEFHLESYLRMIPRNIRIEPLKA